MGKELQELLAAAKRATPSKEQNEEQRRSFAFGNTNIENPNDLRVVTDSARIQVAVKVDGKWATPGLVTFDSIMRFNIDTNSASFVSVDLSAQTQAHSFNFYKVGLADTDGDDHKVEVFARINVDANALTNSGINTTDVSAFIGPRTLTVETAQVDDDE